MRKVAWIKRLAILLVISMVMADLSVPVYASSTTVPAEQVELIDEAETQQTATEGEATVEEPVAEEPVVVEEDAVTEAPVPAVSANEVEETEPEVTEKEVDAVKADPENAIALELDVLYNMSENEAGYYAFTPATTGYYTVDVADADEYYLDSQCVVEWYEESTDGNAINDVYTTKYNFQNARYDECSIYYFTAGVTYLGYIRNIQDSATISVSMADSFAEDNTYTAEDYITVLTYIPSKTGMHTVRSQTMQSLVYKADGTEVDIVHMGGTLENRRYTEYYLEKDNVYAICITDYEGDGEAEVSVETAISLSLDKKNKIEKDEMHGYTYTPTESGFYWFEGQNFEGFSNCYATDGENVEEIEWIIYNSYGEWDATALEYVDKSTQLAYLQAGKYYYFGAIGADNSLNSTVKMTMAKVGTLSDGKKITSNGYWIGKVSLSEAGVYAFGSKTGYGDVTWFDLSNDIYRTMSFDTYTSKTYCSLGEEYLDDDVYVLIKTYSDTSTTFGKVTTNTITCDSSTAYKVPSGKSRVITFTPEEDGIYAIYCKGDFDYTTINSINVGIDNKVTITSSAEEGCEFFEGKADETYNWELKTYSPSGADTDVYITKVEELAYTPGITNTVTSNKPVMLKLSEELSEYTSVTIVDSDYVHVAASGKCSYEDCNVCTYRDFRCKNGKSLITLNAYNCWHYDLEIDDDVAYAYNFDTIYAYSHESTPYKLTIADEVVNESTLEVGDEINAEAGVYEYNIQVEEDGDYRLKSIWTNGVSVELYEINTNEDGKETRIRLWSNESYHDWINEKNLVENVYELEAGKEYVASVVANEEYTIALQKKHNRRVAFDYDEYTAFVASGGTISYVAYDEEDYENNYYNGYINRADEATVYYLDDNKLIISTKNFINQDDIWELVPLNYYSSDRMWITAPGEITYGALANEVERTYHDYAADRYVYNYVYTDALYTVDGDTITAVNMEESIGDETILLAKRTPRLVYVDKIILDVPKTIKSGDTVKINVTLDTATPFEATNKGVTYKSSDTSVLKVDAEGNLTALKAGNATITVKSADGNAKKKVTITVTKQTYTISYELNGGTNNTANPASYAGGKTVTLQTPTKKGYTFEGWYTDPDFAEETQITKLTKGNYVVYAKWSENHYDIAFNGNHASVEGEMESINGIGYDDVVTLSENGFERTGYTFKCWNTKADGSGTSYADGAEVSKLNKNDGSTVTLYAIWTKDKYTISYVMGEGASNSANNPMNYTVTTKTITLAAPTKKGYTFDGWYKDEDCEEEVVTTITKGSTGNVTLYAKWTENQYNIVFNGNHASVTGEMSDMTEIGYDDPVTLTENGFERTGYSFKSWNTKADGSGKTYTDGAEVSKLASKDGKVVNLYAIWKKDKYTITYELDGGTNNTANPATYTVSTKTITLAAPTKKGYMFGGWYTDAECQDEVVTTILKGSTGNKTLYAKWTENQYNIAFNSNHAKATGEMETVSGIGYDDVTALPANEFVRSGYTFKSWNTKADGSGKAYADGAEVSKLASKDGKVVNLYAIWTKDKYTITYELDGGTNNKANPATYTVTTKTITLAAPTKKGYTFGGWYTDAECEEAMTTILKGSTGNVTLYAKWTENEYTIAFNSNHAKATGEMESISGIGYDDPVTLSENGFEREGYTFKSWNTKADGSGKSYADGAEVSKLAAKDGKTVTLYAIWQKEKYTITYVVEDGTNNAKNPATYTITTTTITLKKPKYTGDGFNPTFGGWYTSPDFEEDTKVTTIPKGSTGNMTLYAKWIFG